MPFPGFKEYIIFQRHYFLSLLQLPAVAESGVDESAESEPVTVKVQAAKPYNTKLKDAVNFGGNFLWFCH